MDAEEIGGGSGVKEMELEREETSKAFNQQLAHTHDKKVVVVGSQDRHKILAGNLNYDKQCSEVRNNSLGYSKSDSEEIEEVFEKTERSSKDSRSSGTTEKWYNKLKNLTGVKSRRLESNESDTSVIRQWEDSVEKGNKGMLKMLPRHLTSSVASDASRNTSEADSIECMIDKMVLETRQQSYNRAPDSEVFESFNLTSVTPVNEDLLSKKQGNYKLAFISDENLDSDISEVFTKNKTNQNPTDHEEGKLTIEMKGLEKMGSLDRLLSDQGDIVDCNQANIELDNEYHNALRYSTEDDPELVDLFEKPENKTQTVDRMGNDDIDANLTREEQFLKPKLEAKSSLDLLIDEQGPNIDMQNVEFDKEFLDSLEKQFSTHLKQEQTNSALKKEYSFLGVQLKTETGVDCGTDATKQHGDNGFDQLVQNAETLLGQPPRNFKKQSNDIVDDSVLASPQNSDIPRNSSSTSSEDSDMLSVIEEVEDEYDAADSGTKTDTTSIIRPVQGAGSGENITKMSVQEVQKVPIVPQEPEVTVVNVVKPGIKDKIFNMLKGIGGSDIDDKVQSKGSKNNDTDSNTQEKFIKLNKHWHAVENHEEDVLDFDVEETEENMSSQANKSIESDIENINDKEKETDHFSNIAENQNTREGFDEDVFSIIDNSNEEGNFEVMFNSTLNTPSKNNKFDGKGTVDLKSESLVESEITVEDYCENLEGTHTEDQDKDDISSGANETQEQKHVSLTDSNPICNSPMSDIDVMSPHFLQKFKQRSYLCASISDSHNFCHSIDSELDIDQSGEQPDEEYIVQANNTKHTEQKCDSLAGSDSDQDQRETDEENQQLEEQTNEKIDDTPFQLSEKMVNKNLMLKIDVLRDSCKSISTISTPDTDDGINIKDSNIMENEAEADMSRPRCESIPEEDGGYHAKENLRVCHSIAEHVVAGDLQDIPDFQFRPINDDSQGLESQHTSVEKKTEVSVLETTIVKRADSFRTEVQMVLDDQGKLSPTVAENAQFFKEPPIRPPRTKKITSLLSSSKLPIVSNSAPSDNTLVKMDSSGSGIESICLY